MNGSSLTLAGIPHPLRRFALNGAVTECQEADAILTCITVGVFTDCDSARGHTARMFLLESEQFNQACAIAGLDARKLRQHLRGKFRVLDRGDSLELAGRVVRDPNGA